jgi:uncharacterized protein (DUF433 family)
LVPITFNGHTEKKCIQAFLVPSAGRSVTPYGTGSALVHSPEVAMLKHVEKTPEKLGGTPVFAGTRIPVYLLIDYLREGYSVQEFVDQYDIDPETIDGFLDELGHFVAGDSDTSDADAEKMPA